MATPGKNAIERRIDQIEEIWMEFTANPDARLMRWVGDSESLRMLDLFLELQNEDASESEIPDLFIRFAEPFDDLEQYGVDLKNSLLEKYEDIRQGIEQEGIPAEWSAPTGQLGDSDVTDLVATCASMQRYYDDLMDHLVLVLTPHQVDDPSAWSQWIERLLGGEIPSTVRFLVVDDVAAPCLEQMSDDIPQLLVSVQPDLNLPGAYQELLRGVPGNSPGHTFRRLFVALSTAAAVGNVAMASRSGERALALAEQQGWPELMTVVQMTLGAAHFAAGDADKTLQCYRDAKAATAKQANPTALKLAIQTRFAEAAALLNKEEYAEAAQVYEEIIPLAEGEEDLFAQVESCRMAACCHEMCGAENQAWARAQQALQAGEELDDDGRANSTLPYAGQLLLRLMDRGVNADQRAEIRNQLDSLLGEAWEERLEQGSPS